MKVVESVSRSVVSDSLRPHGLSMEFSRQEYWSGLPFPSPGDLRDPGMEPRPPAAQAGSSPAAPPGSVSQAVGLPWSITVRTTAPAFMAQHCCLTSQMHDFLKPLFGYTSFFGGRGALSSIVSLLSNFYIISFCALLAYPESRVYDKQELICGSEGEESAMQ